MAFDLVAELEALVVAFEAAGIEYALCGGLALAVHGHPRMTQDIDFLVRPEDLARGVEVARNAGFDVPARKMVFGLRAGTPREVQRISKLDDKSGRMLSLDLLVASHELVEVWDSRTRLPWRARTIAVVSRAGLATMKRLAGRPQDLVDLDVLEGRNNDAGDVEED